MNRIVFGAGVSKEALPALGRRALLVTGSRTSPFERDRVVLRITTEPTVDDIRTGVEYALGQECDYVIAVGGGSVIDAGKAIAVLMTNGSEPLDYLEVIGRGKTLANPSAPFIAIPTTAGTGSEATRNAVLSSPEHRLKVSLRSPYMLPTLAIVDPELTYSLPPSLTASTGLDALTQLIEPYVCNRANPTTDAFCLDGMQRAARAFRRNDIDARADMSYASLLGGQALAGAGLGAVHGFASPIGGMFPAPHGAVCAALLPWVTQVNMRHGAAPERYATISRIVGGLHDLCQELEVQPLRTYGIRSEHFPALIEAAKNASSMKANPVVLSDADLHEILERAL